tara:strand:- start:1911 stop:2735 length:825 start_codon:yes stop_codon:yes gene_type:complete
MISIFTTYTDPEKRNDPWEEAMECYKEFAEEVVVTGQDWPYEFSWNHIGETFQKGFNESSGDWVIRMDIDYFFHENDLNKIKSSLEKYSEYPAVSFPQYQFFTPDRYHLKTRLCVALNKRKFPNIKLNGGGDLCLATLDNKLIKPSDVPSLSFPIYQYDSIFRTKEIIKEDRARFARAWYRYFNTYEPRGGPTEEEAYEAWFNEIKNKFQYHTNKMSRKKHPKYIIKKLNNLNEKQFGFDCFGLNKTTSRNYRNFLAGKKELYFGSSLINRNLN